MSSYLEDFLQPHDVVSPFFNENPMTSSSSPQSQTQCHLACLAMPSAVPVVEPARPITVNDPNRCPVRSSTTAAETRSFCKHPHEVLMPVFKALAPTSFTVPHSQRHFHMMLRVLPLFEYRVGAGPITVHLPKRCPVRSSFRASPASLWAQPQDFLSPFSNIRLSASVSLPQSHMHL